MNREQFLAQAKVAAFVAWLVEQLPTLPVHLHFARSKFVPARLDLRVSGVEAVLAHYQWRAHWCDPVSGMRIESGDWTTTHASLKRLSECLRECVASSDDLAAGAIAREVLRWGGVRGAIPFIERKVREASWCKYLNTLAPLFALDGEQDSNALHGGNVQRFDSGLTKIHALLDTTGSPIYDSRVGAALAMLYALFRRDAAQHGFRHGVLEFPSGQARGQQIRNAGELGFAASPQLHTRAVTREAWAQWQLRAGWIIRSVLEQTTLFGTGPAGETVSTIAARCHAFEAALFMIGYDLRSLAGDTKQAPHGVNAQSPAPVPPVNLNWVPTGHNLSMVLSAYREFRETLPADLSQESLKHWLHEPLQADRYPAFGKAFSSYRYPLRETELNLADRSLEEVQAIEQGGAKGLRVLTDDDALEFVERDEREQVCLVAAGLAGYCQLMASAANPSSTRLIRKQLAGTPNAANTLLAVGRQIGRHFGLLNKKNQTTVLFHSFYGDGFDYFRSRLNVERDGRDLDLR